MVSREIEAAAPAPGHPALGGTTRRIRGPRGEQGAFGSYAWTGDVTAIPGLSVDDSDAESAPYGPEEEGLSSRRRRRIWEEGTRLMTGEDSAPLHEDEWNRRVWARYAHQESPNVFSKLVIASDGGFSEVKDLWYPLRWLTALLGLAFIASNVYFIVSVDSSILLGQRFSKSRDGMFLVTGPVAQVFLRRETDGDDLIALWELCGLTVLISNALHQLVIARGTGSEYLKWFALERFYWELVPQLSTYSSMRLLHNVSPTVFLNTITTLVGEMSNYTRGDCIWGWVKFLLFHLFCLVVGFDSFLVKIRAAYTCINSKRLTIGNLYQALVFMVQVMGIIRLGTFVQQRLFIFIFAGEDSVMQAEEKAKQRVWNALLVRKIWRTYTAPKAVAIMLSFSDSDFQRLVLNERQEDGSVTAVNTDLESESDA